METLTPPSPGTLPNLPGVDCDARLHEASFSSYLNTNEECFARKLASTVYHGRKFGMAELKGSSDGYDDDGEIGVFEAEKYFNGSIDENSPSLMRVMAQQTESMKSSSSQTYGMTPSTGSQLSGNSQTLLLQRQRQPRRKVSEVRSKSLLASIICCRCSCDNDDSVDVGFRDGHNRFVPRGQWPPDFVLEKKLTMLPWSDVVPRKEDQNALDSCSDASSDLFEIESLTGKANRLLTWHDAASASAYAPSEASVEWSVVTASAAATEFSFDDRSELAGTTSPERRSVKGSNKRNRNKNRKERPRSGILLRC